MTPTVTGNQQLISPNQQYNGNSVGPNGSTNVNPNAPPQIDIADYNNAFGQQPQQQQQQQQQYHRNNFGSAGATHWETKFNPTAVATNNNLDNLTNANAFTMHNLLTPASADVVQANGTDGTGNNWNLGSNHFHSQQHHLQQQQHHQQYQQQTTPNDAMTTANNTAVGVANIISGNNENNNNNNTNNNNNEHGLSNLLTFDSGQLVRMNSEDQQMLRLNTEDLQISNLSIST
ncbi:hypothetical protein DOY81_005972 [Sarcophaga bullata]|nr:hypothetical protein DOY81_005972 [Sarcophaga bullata]